MAVSTSVLDLGDRAKLLKYLTKSHQLLSITKNRINKGVKIEKQSTDIFLFDSRLGCLYLTHVLRAFVAFYSVCVPNVEREFHFPRRDENREEFKEKKKKTNADQSVWFSVTRNSKNQCIMSGQFYARHSVVLQSLEATQALFPLSVKANNLKKKRKK